MRIEITEAGKPPGQRVEFATDVQHAVLRIGGAPPCEVVVPGLAGVCAEVRVSAGQAELANVGGSVRLAGREVPKGSALPLGAEVLVSIDKTELIVRTLASRGGAPSVPSFGSASGAGLPAPMPFGVPDSVEQPSVIAKNMLKEVYAALGVPENNPALVVFDENNKVVKRIDLVPPQEDVTIGRNPASRLVLFHNSVSKDHAHVMRDGLGFLVKDLGSKNGTKVNGQVISGQARLKSGDRIAIGDFTLRYVDPKVAVQDLAQSVPDLKKLERAGPGERVKVGGSGDLGATTAFEESMLKQAEKTTGRRAEEPSAGLLVLALIGLGVLLLLGLVAVVVLVAM